MMGGGDWRRAADADTPCSLVKPPLADYMWGVDDTGSQSRDNKLHKAAISLCDVCPVQHRCLAYAIVCHVSSGIMGGLNVTERNFLARLIEADGINVRSGKCQEDKQTLMQNVIHWLQSNPDYKAKINQMAADIRANNRKKQKAFQDNQRKEQLALF